MGSPRINRILARELGRASVAKCKFRVLEPGTLRDPIALPLLLALLGPQLIGHCLLCLSITAPDLDAYLFQEQICRCTQKGCLIAVRVLCNPIKLTHKISYTETFSDAAANRPLNFYVTGMGPSSSQEEKRPFISLSKEMKVTSTPQDPSTHHHDSKIILARYMHHVYSNASLGHKHSMCVSAAGV